MGKRKKKPLSDTRKVRRTSKRPWIAVATICERALIENDKTASVVRIIDTITVEADSSEMPPGIAKVTLFVMFRGGPAIGTKRFTLTGLSPSGETIITESRDVQLLGEEHASILNIQLQTLVSEVGLYWFEIRLDGNLETRVPLRGRYRRKSQSAGKE
jgi:hypothetical protein